MDTQSKTSPPLTRVRERTVPEWTGVILTPGTDVSLVRWDDGRERYVSNRYLQAEDDNERYIPRHRIRRAARKGSGHRRPTDGRGSAGVGGARQVEVTEAPTCEFRPAPDPRPGRGLN